MKNFGYYIQKGEVRKTTRDINLAESLVKRSKENGDYILKLKLTENGASIIFRNLYDCLRELIDAILILEGYKSYSHQASIIFLKKFTEFSEEARQEQLGVAGMEKIVSEAEGLNLLAYLRKLVRDADTTH